MKKIFYTLAMLLMSISMQAQNYNRYDVNHDGKITIEDATWVINHCLGKTNVYVSDIKLTCDRQGIIVGNTTKISASVIPSDADIQTLQYSSSGNNIATVDQQGVVTAISEGEATIYVSSTDGSNITAPIKITVLPEGSHEYVDLGLSVKWATCNVGANSPTGYGDYFAWGETSSKEYYDRDNYLYYKTTTTKDGDGFDVTTIGYTKYVTKADASKYGYDGFYDDKTTLDPEDDAATTNWGGSWKTPTFDEWNELQSNCKWQVSTLNGVKGVKVTSTNGNYIFLPCAGYYNGYSNPSIASQCRYQSSTQGGSKDNCWYFYCSDSSHCLSGYQIYSGYSVRPVLVE